MTVFGMHHQLGGSTEDDMNKMSVIGHISLNIIMGDYQSTLLGCCVIVHKVHRYSHTCT